MSIFQLAKAVGLNKSPLSPLEILRLGKQAENPAIKNVVHYMLGGGKPLEHKFPDEVIQRAAEQALDGGYNNIAFTRKGAYNRFGGDYTPRTTFGAEMHPALARVLDGLYNADLLSRNEIMYQSSVNAAGDIATLDRRNLSNPNQIIYRLGAPTTATEALQAHGMPYDLFWNTFGGYGIEMQPNNRVRVLDSYRFYPMTGGTGADISLMENYVQEALERYKSGDTDLYKLGAPLVSGIFENHLSRLGHPFMLTSNSVEMPKSYFDAVKDATSGDGHIPNLGFTAGGFGANTVKDFLGNAAFFGPLAALQKFNPALAGKVLPWLQPAMGVVTTATDPVLRDQMAHGNPSGLRMAADFAGATPMLESGLNAASIAAMSDIVDTALSQNWRDLPNSLLAVQSAGERGLKKIGKTLGREFNAAPFSTGALLASFAISPLRALREAAGVIPYREVASRGHSIPLARVGNGDLVGPSTAEYYGKTNTEIADNLASLRRILNSSALTPDILETGVTGAFGRNLPGQRGALLSGQNDSSPVITRNIEDALSIIPTKYPTAVTNSRRTMEYYIGKDHNRVGGFALPMGGNTGYIALNPTRWDMMHETIPHELQHANDQNLEVLGERLGQVVRRGAKMTPEEVARMFVGEARADNAAQKFTRHLQTIGALGYFNTPGLFK